MLTVFDKRISIKITTTIFAIVGLCFGQTTWKLINPLSSNNVLHSIAYGNNQFVVVGDSGTILSSSNCSTWTKTNLDPTKHITSVTYGNGIFVANGDTDLTSVDGTTWSIKSTNISFNPISVFCNSLFIGMSGGNILTSLDGNTWTIKRSYNRNDTIEYLTSVAYGSGLFVAVGYCAVLDNDNCYSQPCPYKMNSGLFFTSSDGTTWTQINSGTAITLYNYLTSVTYGNGLFVAVSPYEDYICSSSDGITWTQNTVDKIDNNSVIYGNGTFIAVGKDGTIITSPDGTTWTKQNSGTIKNLNSVVYGKGLFIVIGDSGIILVSKANPSSILLQSSAKLKIGGLKINIAKNNVSALLPDAIRQGQLKVSLFNVSGKQIYSATTGTQNGILNIPSKGFPTGKYFISIKDENNRTLSSSFVLTR